MRYMDLLLILFLLCLFSWHFSGGLKVYSKLKNKSEYFLEKKSANEFISKSFKNTCEGIGFSSLNEWQKSCKAMWELKYIGWSDAKDVMLLSEECKQKVLYGTWKGNDYIGEVYWMEE